MESSTSNRVALFAALAGVKGPSGHSSVLGKLISHESPEVYLTSHEGEESVDSIFPLQIFYSQDRWLKENEDLGFISAGSIGELGSY